jgi:hypothetical protein
MGADRIQLVLWFERQVVAALVSPTSDDCRRSAINAYVDGALASMPEYLRVGVAGESVLFGIWHHLRGVTGRRDGEVLKRRITGWEASRVDPVRQYARLLQSLVLFAENELEPLPD